MSFVTLPYRGNTSYATSTIRDFGAKRPRGTDKTEDRDGGFYTGQYQKYEFRLGKKVRLDRLLNKLDRRETPTEWHRFGNVNRLTDPQGPYKLNYNTNTSDPAPLPLYVIDLTSRAKFGSAPYHRTMHRANQQFGTVAGTNDSVTFTPENGVMIDGTTTTDVWQIYRSKGCPGNADPLPCPAAILEYTDAKFVFTAPTSRSGYVKIMLVQLHDPFLSPQADVTAARTAAYQNLCKPLLYNPILTGNQTNNNRHFTVLKTWTKNFYPDDSGNRDTNGQKIRMDLFIRHNRYVQFRPFSENPYQNAPISAVDKLDGDVVIRNDDGAVNILPQTYFNYTANAQARVYLFVMGTSYEGRSVIRNASNEISFDMDIRNKWLYRDISRV